MAKHIDYNNCRMLLAAGKIEEAKSLFNIHTHQPERTLKKCELPISYQKKIAASSLALLFKKPVKLIQLSESTDEAFTVLKGLWNDMRMASVNRKNARSLFFQTASAKLFIPYCDSDTSGPVKVKCILLSKKNGDNIYTKKDRFGLMECIAREYSVCINNKSVNHFDAYFNNVIFYCTKTDGKWLTESKLNPIRKIPISYYNQEDTGWNDVLSLIEKLEILTSKTNDFIYLPDFSPDQLNSLSRDSKSALEIHFLPAILRSMDKQELFAEMADREINIIKALISNVIRVDLAPQIKNLSVGIDFGNPAPDDFGNIPDLLSTIFYESGAS